MAKLKLTYGRSEMTSRRNTRSETGQSSGPAQDGVFLTPNLIMEFVRNAQPAADPPPRMDFARLCSDYSHLGGRPFKGSKSVINVQAWLRTCERIFNRMGLSDLHRVQVASSQLQERALDWYDLLSAEINEAGLVWDQFRARFELKFLPEAEKTALAWKFIDLRQGSS